MHRIDGDAQYPAGHFSEGDPAAPRLPTQVTAAWLDNVQEELATLVTTAGGVLSKGTAQLQTLLANLSTTQTFTALKTFSAGLRAAASEFTGLLTASAGFSATHHSNCTTTDAVTPTLTLANFEAPGCIALNVTNGLTSIEEDLSVLGHTELADCTVPTLTASVLDLKGYSGGANTIKVGFSIGGPPGTGAIGDVVFVLMGGVYYIYLCVTAGTPAGWHRAELTGAP